MKNYILFSFSKRETGYKPLYTLVKTDLRIAQALQSFGVDNHKSYTIRFPSHINLNFSSYLRGLFDADGHISKRTTNNGIQIGFTAGSKAFLEDIIKQIELYLPAITKHTISEGKSGKGVWYQLRYSGKNAKLLLEFIYSTKNNLFMDRKFQKYKLLVGS